MLISKAHIHKRALCEQSNKLRASSKGKTSACSKKMFLVKNSLYLCVSLRPNRAVALSVLAVFLQNGSQTIIPSDILAIASCS